MAKERQRQPVRAVPSRARMTLSWLVAGGSSLAFSLVVATIGYYVLGIKNGSALVVALGLLVAAFSAVHALSEHRRELFAWRNGTAARAIAASRFQTALRVLERQTRRYETNAQGGAANWIRAYAALHDGRTDEALRLCERGTLLSAQDRAAFIALRALAFAVRRDHARSYENIDAVRAMDRASSFDLALCDLAHGVNARSMPRDSDSSSLEILLLDADVALLRRLRHRALLPYRVPVVETNEEESKCKEEAHSSAIRKWIATALPEEHNEEVAVQATPAAIREEEDWLIGRFRHKPIGREAGALFGLAVTCFLPVLLAGNEKDEIALLAFTVAAAVTTGVFGLPLARRQPSPDEPAGHVAAFQRADTKSSTRTRVVTTTEPPAEHRQIEVELFEALTRARDLEAKGESGSALTLADKCIWQIDSGGFDWAAPVILPELIAVRARCLAMLGLPAEAEHEIGELRKHFEFLLTPLVEWQVGLRSALACGDDARVLRLAEQRPDECTQLDRDLIASVIENEVDEGADEEAKKRRG